MQYTYLNSKWCNVLRSVYVVVEAGGEGEEPVGGDEERVDEVPVEREREQGLHELSSNHRIRQP